MLLAVASAVVLAAGCTGESAASSPSPADAVPQVLDPQVLDPHEAHPSSHPSHPSPPAADHAGGTYEVTIARDEGDLPAGGSYTVTVPRLTGPDAEVVDRVNTAVDDYVAAEKSLTQGATLTLEAGDPYVGAQVLALSFGGDRFLPGTAHPAKLATGLVFDLRTGAPVRIEDVFTSTADGLDRLASVVRADLDGRFPDGTTRGATDPSPANYREFVVNPSGLVVVVVDLPNVIGPQSVLVPWEHLGDVVRPELLPVLLS